MKKFLFALILIPSALHAAGPKFHHQDQVEELEFRNVYQDIKSLYVSSMTLPGGSTFYIQNTNSLQTGSTSYANFVYTSSLTVDGLGAAIKGTTTNNDARPGDVGQSSIAVNTTLINFPTSTNYGDANSITLTAGDWDISYIVYANIGTANWSAVYFGLSTTSGNSSTGLNFGDNAGVYLWAASATTPLTTVGVIPAYRVSISASTTYYGKIRSDYGSGQPKYAYRISARRVR